MLEQVKKLNKDIEKYFQNFIVKIEPHFNITFEGVSRMVMLDRYAQKDRDFISLGVNDLVLVIVKHDIYFPTKAIGIIKEMDKNSCIVQLEEDFVKFIDQEDLIGNNCIKREKTDIEKPLEIYFEQIANRVANEISKAEIDQDTQNKYRKEFYNAISSLKLIPAGRILYGAGSTSKVTLFNCFVLPFIHDSRKGLAKHREEIMEIMSRGGGVGTNGSTLRPKGTIAKQVGGQSSGAVSWLDDLARLTHLIQQGGSRRGAQMIMLADWHPDLIELIVSKMQNIKMLEYLATNGKDARIRFFAKNKIKFVPIDEKTKISYETIVNDEQYRKKLNDNQLQEIETILEKGGEFIGVNLEQLEGANLSVTISDKFMEAVKNDKMWEFKFPDLENYTIEEKEYYDKYWHLCGDVFEWESKHKMKLKTYFAIKARIIWDLIVFCATYSAEPGLFFIDRANTYTNAQSYDMKVIATNPCGEQPLPPYAVCNLGALNLDKFVNKQTKEILWKELEDTIRIAIRFHDNVIDRTPFFLDANKKIAIGERRIGLGVMGLHDLLIWTGHVYGSKKSLLLLDKLFRFIAETAYDASANLALEKGEFSYLKNNRQRFVKTAYCKQLSKKVRAKILAQGIRNSHLLTIAPTGTTGTMIGVSTGLEPYFGFTYYRSGRLGENIKVDARIVKEYMKINNISKKSNLPKSFVIANHLTPKKHVDVQIAIQKWIDSSISKTVNAPRGFSVEQVEEVYITLYENNAKGGTVYVDGSRNGQVLNLLDSTSKEKQLSLNVFDNQDDDVELNKKVLGKEGNLRANRLDRPIGNKVGNICPLCLEGTIVRSNGCNTCNNCGAQLSCEV